MTGDQIWEIIAFLAAVVIFIPIFYRFKVNPLLAFIAAGVILGPHGLGVIKDMQVADNVGELGLLFLMFSIGLDLSFHRFKAMREYIFGYGAAQMAATAIIFGAAAYLLHKNVNEAIIIGVALAMSSTAVALRLMQGRGEMHTPAGRATVGILLLQDLAVIPTMVLLPRMAANSGASVFDDLSQSFLRAIGAITLIILIGRMVMKPLFRFVASTKNHEAFTSLIFLVFLATAWATNMAGLSVSLGAFIGGMLIAETDFGHEVEAEVESFSSLLLGIFFLSVGMMIDVQYALSHIPQILLLTALVMSVKFGVIFLLENRLGVSKVGSATSAIFLCQAGEFGFVIFNLAAQSYKILSPTTSTQLQVVVALSMALTPFVSNFVLKQIDKRQSALTAAKDAASSVSDDHEEEDMEDHVLVVGYGRVGQAAARLLARNDVPLFVIDTDVQHIERAKKNGRPCLFGSAANEKILNVANINKAKSVLICISGLPTAMRVLKAVREINQTIPVFIRCNDDTRWTELTKLGATGVISETQECGIRLAAATIIMQGGDEVRLKETAAILRQENTVNPPLPTAPSI